MECSALVKQSSSWPISQPMSCLAIYDDVLEQRSAHSCGVGGAGRHVRAYVLAIHGVVLPSSTCHWHASQPLQQQHVAAIVLVVI